MKTFQDYYKFYSEVKQKTIKRTEAIVKDYEKRLSFFTIAQLRQINKAVDGNTKDEIITELVSRYKLRATALINTALIRNINNMKNFRKNKTLEIIFEDDYYKIISHNIYNEVEFSIINKTEENDLIFINYNEDIKIKISVPAQYYDEIGVENYIIKLNRLKETAKQVQEKINKIKNKN